MTEAQRKRLYFPAWQAAKAVCWRWENGRFSRRVEPASQWMEMIEDVARQIAGPEHRGLVADDLRHGCNALAVRRERAYRANLPEEQVPLDLRPAGTTSSALSDRHDVRLGLFLALCDLLVDDTCLSLPHRPGGVMAWEHPEQIEREYLLRVIDRRCNAGFVARLCKDLNGTPDPAALRLDRLEDLYRTLGQRRNAWQSNNAPRPQARAVEPEEAECPF